mmetsp:Transcript_8752/g.22285  ORF Transcript_8752/g.22285 Transcript_8752/m.22285 type:complete len:407 (-) Transcript_8752:576-1796(-)
MRTSAVSSNRVSASLRNLASSATLPPAGTSSCCPSSDCGGAVCEMESTLSTALRLYRTSYPTSYGPALTSSNAFDFSSTTRHSPKSSPSYTPAAPPPKTADSSTAYASAARATEALCVTPQSPSVSCTSIANEASGLLRTRARKVTVISTEPSGSSTPEVGQITKSGGCAITSAPDATATAATGTGTATTAAAAAAPLAGAGAPLPPPLAAPVAAVLAAATASLAARARRSRSACGTAHCTGNELREYTVVLRVSERPSISRSKERETSDRAMRGAVPMAPSSNVTGVGLPFTAHTSVSAKVPSWSGEAVTRMSAVSSLRNRSELGSTLKMATPETPAAASLPGVLGRPSSFLPAAAAAGGAAAPPSAGCVGGVKWPTPLCRKEKKTSASKGEVLLMWKTSVLAAA